MNKNILTTLSAIAIAILLTVGITQAASTPTTNLSSSGGTTTAGLFTDSDPYSQTYDCSEWDEDSTVYAWHKHGYINEGGPDDDYYLASIIYRFRIYLEDDFVENIDLDDLECATPVDGELVSCDGGETEYDGGTIIELYLESRGDDGNYIQWTYGQDDFDDIPILPGINYYDSGYDTSDESERTFSEVVSFTFKDDVESGATATTNSAVQIKHKAMNIDTGAWIEIEDNDGNTGWHWNEHTVTLETDYICESIYCEDLDMTPTALTAEEAEDTFRVTATSEASDGTDWEDAPDFAGYKYWAIDDTGSYSGEFATADSAWNWLWADNPLETSDSEVYFRGGNTGDIIYVCAVDSDGTCLTQANGYEEDCIAAITSVPEEITCDYMTMNPNGTLTATGPAYSMNITIETIATDGGLWEGTADWTLSCTTASITPPSPTDNNTTVLYEETAQAEETTCCVYAEDTVADWCNAQVCFVLEGGEVTDGDVTDGDVTDGDVSDGDVSDGDVSDGDVSDGDVSDGDVSDGDVSDGDVTDGDVTDGDVTDGDVTPPEKHPGNLEKEAKSYNFSTDGTTTGYYLTDSTTLAHDKDYIYYTLIYTAGKTTSAHIEDTLQNNIPGYLDNGTPTGSFVSYESGTFGIDINACTDPEDTSLGPIPCYTLDNSSNPLSGINIYNLEEGDEITMLYTARVTSYLDCNNLSADVCMAEYFENVATAEEDSISGQIEVTKTVTVICPYLLTRNAGDVYLENEMTSGASIACVAENEFRNTDGLLMVNEIAESIEDVLNHFSSYITEIFYTQVRDWQTIEEDSASHIARATYNYNTAMLVTSEVFITDWADLENYRNLNNPSDNIYYFEGQDVTFKGGEMIIPEGAYTIIVENADLNFDAYTNLVYADAYFGFNYYQYADTDTLDTVNLPSVAFIVINGDININHSVVDLVGVYYVEGGSIRNSGAERNPIGEQLRIYGSVYGDIDPLLQESGFVGPPELDHGAIVIRYDERVILNTPPGLSEYVDFYSSKTAR